MSAGRTIGGVAVAEPLVLEMANEPIRQRYIEIIDAASGGRAVTIVEFVPPTNKLPGDGRIKYRRKQQECLGARANLAEIDLTREGDRELLVSPWELPPEWRTTYMACVYRGWWKESGRREAYRLALRQRLPAIRLPLRSSDPDIVLDLQPLVDDAYRAGAYDRTIDYHRPVVPPMAPKDAAWADELLKAAGRR